MVSFKEFCNEEKDFKKKVQGLLKAENQYPFSLLDNKYTRDRLDVWIEELNLFDKKDSEEILKYIKDVSIKNINNLSQAEKDKYKKYLEDTEDYMKLPKFPWEF